MNNIVKHTCRVGIKKGLLLPRRLNRQLYLHFTLPKQVERSQIKWSDAENNDFQKIRATKLAYINSNKRPKDGVGAYSYKPNGPALLYASCYAALTRHLYGDLETIPIAKKVDLIRYIQKHQCDDGLFRDQLINIPLAENADWWGWRHLTLHALMALKALGGIAKKKFLLLDFFRKPGVMAQWLDTRNWKIDPASVSNEIQNLRMLIAVCRGFLK